MTHPKVVKYFVKRQNLKNKICFTCIKYLVLFLKFFSTNTSQQITDMIEDKLLIRLKVGY
jgi:hypothetical protein